MIPKRMPYGTHLYKTSLSGGRQEDVPWTNGGWSLERTGTALGLWVNQKYLLNTPVSWYILESAYRNFA